MAASNDLRDVVAAATGRERFFRPQRPLGLTVEALALAIPDAQSVGAGDVRVTGVSLDSRAILPGDLYAALSGAHTHGSEFIVQAVEQGAAAILTDEEGREAATRSGVPAIIVDDARAMLGRVSTLVFGTNEHQPQLFGVTGTNGKTTTTLMISSILQAMGLQTGTIGTIGITVGDENIPATLTTPESPQLHGLLAKMAERSVNSAVMEVSSHSMVYQRTAGLSFAVAGFTNLTQDHLDLHGTMEGYFAAKLSLFHPDMAVRGVVMIDDEWGQRLARDAQIPVVTVSTDGSRAGAWFVTDVVAETIGHSFFLQHHDGRSLRALVGVPGDFNVSNAALALAMIIEAGYAIDDVVAAVGSAQKPLSRGIPGRMEILSTSPTVYVDFAHNPGGLLSVLDAVQTPRGRVIVVFGAAGERDALKRATMGEIAARLADVIIVTDDDPHAEDAASIRAQVLEGALAAKRSGGDVREVYPRAAAIHYAVTQAHPDDVVVVAGRGHETEQDMAGSLVAIDDREEVRAALAARLSASSISGTTVAAEPNERPAL